MKSSIHALVTLAAVSFFANAAEPVNAPAKALAPDVIRGKYLVQITGCNDCHTPGYLVTEGKVEEANWLTGSPLGWRGPWGTTYAPNLRLTARDNTAEQFMALGRSARRPPMPWFNLRAMKDSDLKAIYAYVKYLGPAGEAAPAYVPPDQVPKGPFVTFPAPPPGAKP